MCHGITDNGRCMLRLAEHLASRYNVILIDARGHGLSEAPESGYTADHHADDIGGLIAALGLVHPILYGHSMGARTVSRFAAKHADLPRAVILEDPVYIIPPTENELKDLEVWVNEMQEEVIRWKTMTFEEHLESAKEQGHPDWTIDGQIEWAKAKLQVDPKVFNIGKSMLLIRDDFPDIKCPVLLLKADADCETKGKNEDAARLLPNGKIIHVAGAGHNIRRDDFSATTHFIDGFLQRL